MYAGTATLVTTPSRIPFGLHKSPNPKFSLNYSLAFSRKLGSRKIFCVQNASWCQKTMLEFTETKVSSGDIVEDFLNSYEHGSEQSLIHDGVPLSHSATWINITMNAMSKWFMAAIFVFIVVMEKDGKGLWYIIGTILNIVLSTTLKNILNQQRPPSTFTSGPGMPSSHAQSIFFALQLTTASMVEWLGLNSATIMLSGLLIGIGSYFSWLRVLLNYHTKRQVTVGAILGSIFSVLWLWVWNVSIKQAFHSFFWVRICVLIGAVGCCGGFLFYVYHRNMN